MSSIQNIASVKDIQGSVFLDPNAGPSSSIQQESKEYFSIGGSKRCANLKWNNSYGTNLNHGSSRLCASSFLIAQESLCEILKKKKLQSRVMVGFVASSHTVFKSDHSIATLECPNPSEHHANMCMNTC